MAGRSRAGAFRDASLDQGFSEARVNVDDRGTE
jgi:hypothetical protein